MRIVLAVLLSLAPLAVAGFAVADEKSPAPMTAEAKAMTDAFARMGEIRAEHKQLEYFVGSWKTKQTVWMSPGAPPEIAQGTAVISKLWGGRYLELRQESTMMGQPYSGMGHIGFDNLKGKFINTWLDSMSTGIWFSLGSYDAKAKTYIFTGQMDDPMAAGTIIPVRIVERILDNNHYIFEWYESHDSKQAKTMQIEYARN